MARSTMLWENGVFTHVNDVVRERKVTITELSDEEDDGDWTFVDDPKSAVIESVITVDTDEAFRQLDDVVQDWKSKLELLVGEGLKKLRKNGKDKKLMMKYLPEGGKQKNLDEAKAAVYKDWKNEFNQVLGQTQRRMERLNADKMAEARDLIDGRILAKAKKVDDEQRKKKAIVKLEVGNGEGSFLDMMKNLEKVCDFYQMDQQTLFKSEVPIYQPKTVIKEKNPKSDSRLTSYHLRPISSRFLRENGFEIDEPSTPISAEPKVAAEKPFKDNKKVEVTRTKTSSSLNIVQIKKNGKERFLIVRKKEKKMNQHEAEEIFQEWLKNLEAPRSKRVENGGRRVRKLSHRAQRKESIKSYESNKPLLYSDILKKNLPKSALNVDPEDFFQDFRDQMFKEARDEKKTVELTGEDYFWAWRHNLSVNMTPKESEEQILASSKIHFDALNAGGKPTVFTLKGCNNDDDEEIFASWRHNLIDKSGGGKKSKALAPMPENIFHDWLKNLQIREEFCKGKIAGKENSDDFVFLDLQPEEQKIQQTATKKKLHRRNKKKVKI